MKLLPSASRNSAFTLLELLVVMGVIAVLAMALMAGIQKVRMKSAELAEMGRVRRLGLGILSWTSDHGGILPRSSHSAIGHGELGWQREILPHLGYPDTSRATFELAKKPEFGIDPTVTPARCPALNVYFELDPDYDDYQGAPKSWRNMATVPNASTTVLLTTAFGNADHIMAQYFTEKANDLPAPRDGGNNGPVLWLDSRVTKEPIGSLFDPARSIDRFHPELSWKN